MMHFECITQKRQALHLGLGGILCVVFDGVTTKQTTLQCSKVRADKKKDKKTYLPENKKNCDALSESDARADQKLLYFFVWPNVQF